MIHIFDLFENICGRVNTQQGGAIRPHRDFLQWCNDISVSLFEEKFAGGWEKSQKIQDDLTRPFLVSVNLPVTNTPGSLDGNLPFPKDYGHFSAARYIQAMKGDKTLYLPKPGKLCCDGEGALLEKDCKPAYIDEETWDAIQSQKEAEKKNSDEKPYAGTYEKVQVVTVDKVRNSEWTGMLEDRFSRPTMELPKITQYDGGFKVAPAGIGIINLDYLRKPKPATFEYTVVPGDPVTGKGDYIVYNRTTSVPLEWSELVINEFITRLEKTYGKKIREGFIWETSESDRKSTV